MGLPKRRFSRSRRDKRRTQIHLKPATLTRCSQCGASVVSHRICTTCGFYRGRLVISVEKKKEVKRKS